MRRVTKLYDDMEDGTECELSFTPTEYLDVHRAKVGDKWVIAYCVQDDHYEIDDMIGDCMGKMIQREMRNNRGNDADVFEALGFDRDGNYNLDVIWDKHQAEASRRYVDCVLHEYGAEATVTEYEERTSDYERREGETLEQTARRYVTADVDESYGWQYVVNEEIMQDVLKEMWDEPAYFPGDKDALMLDLYDHSGQSWSLSGGGMQCRWDTSRGAGVWVPDDSLRKQLDDDEAKGMDRDAQARKYAKQFLETYNALLCGDVYGCVVQWNDEDGELIDEESCWGFIGSEYANEALKSEFFDPMCERLLKEYEIEVHTQGGRQMEIEA